MDNNTQPFELPDLRTAEGKVNVDAIIHYLKCFHVIGQHIFNEIQNGGKDEINGMALLDKLFATTREVEDMSKEAQSDLDNLKARLIVAAKATLEKARLQLATVMPSSEETLMGHFKPDAE